MAGGRHGTYVGVIIFFGIIPLDGRSDRGRNQCQWCWSMCGFIDNGKGRGRK